MFRGTSGLYQFLSDITTTNPLVTLAAMLGHSRVQMVMRYAHPTEEHQFQAMRKMEKFVAGGLTKSGKWKDATTFPPTQLFYNELQIVVNLLKVFEAAIGIEPMNKGFAEFIDAARRDPIPLRARILHPLPIGLAIDIVDD